MTTLELAAHEDWKVCSEIIDAGRAFQREQGFTQWTEEYPNPDTIREDIQKQKGYVVRVEKETAGYLCLDFDGEPAYETIQGNWHTGEPYAVVHRLAFHPKFRGIGLAGITFQKVEELCRKKGIRAIRIDTDFPNKRMQHILEKNGYVRCGVIVFQGSEKLAYDKILTD